MTTTRARRMTPTDRQVQILDAATKLIVATGHSGVSLEQIAAAAGISKPLIYKYFPKREDLLKALLVREFEILRGRGLNEVPRDIAPERVIRSTVKNALSYYFERGPIVRLISADPAVAEMARAGNRASRRNTTDYFIAKFMESYGVPLDVAQIAVTLVVNAPINAIGSLQRRGIGAERTIDVWTDFIIGGWSALEAKYGGKARSRRRAR
ncbi:MAG: TetR/AcrR family transcriptional regulator [Proteobacteria bacterium]|nr:TetR/AcrR family transcriptional regulator [Pseudomonadota bacterium]